MFTAGTLRYLVVSLAALAGALAALPAGWFEGT
jgi:hypothetical protein